jgi:hypothetical protein
MPGRLPGIFLFWPLSCPEVSLPWAENLRAWPESRSEASNRAKTVSRPRMRLLHLPAIVYCYRQVFLFPNLVRQHFEKVRVHICQLKKNSESPEGRFRANGPTRVFELLDAVLESNSVAFLL